MSQYTGPVLAGTVRAPRLQILLNGAAMQGVTGASWEPNNQFEAATFTIEGNVEPVYAMNAAWWLNQGKVTVQIQVGYDPGNGIIPWQTVLTGVVDQGQISLDDRTIRVTGRDLVAQLIDTKTAQAYQNNTASEIVTLLAQNAGLQITDGQGNSTVTHTTTLVGTYYQIDHNRMALGGFHSDITQWDLLKYLAQQEGFDLFVSGTALYFQPPATTADAYNIFWTLDQDGIPVSNVIGLSLEHSLTLAKGVSVTVKSWNSKLAKPIIATTADPDYKTSPGQGTQDYVFYVPNLTLQGAIDIANQRYADITRHLRTIEFEIPGDTVLTPRNLIVLNGTGTAFDQSYYPDRISCSLSQGGGFNMRVTAKNVPPTPQALIT